MKIETSPDCLLAKTTDGFFQHLGRKRQKRLRILVRENVFKRVADYWKGRQSGVTLVGDQLSVIWSGADEKDDFINWIEGRRNHFDAGKLPVEDQTVFEWPDADTRGV